MTGTQLMKSCEKRFEFGSEQQFFIDKKPMEECVICMELINDKDKAVLKCGHSFHASCMFSSVVKENNTCPLCRTEVSEKPEKKPEMTEGLMHIFIQNEFNRGNLSRATSAIFKKHLEWFQHYGSGEYEDVSLERRKYMSEELIHVMVEFGMSLGGQVNNWIRDGDSRLHIPQEFTENEPIRVPIEAYMPVEPVRTGVEESNEEHYGGSDTDSDMPELVDASDEEQSDMQSLALDNEIIRRRRVCFRDQFEEDDEENDEDSRYTENDVNSLSSDSQFSIPSIYYDENDEEEIEPINLQPLFEDSVNTSESDVVAAWRESFESEREREWIYTGWVESTEHILQTSSANNGVIDCFPHNDSEEPTYFIERIRGNQWLYYNLADATIEEIMWPIGGPGARPLFSQQQAEAIFGEILRYHAEGLE